jgi:chitodextrinase
MMRRSALVTLLAAAIGFALVVMPGAQADADTTPPTTPTGLRASMNCSAVLTLIWNASTDNVAVTGYDIFSEVSTGTFALATTTTTTSFTGRLIGITYKVRARDAAGNTSGFTPTVTAVPPPCPPPDTQPPTTPGTPTATITCGSAVLRWTPSTDNLGLVVYEIYRASGTVGGPLVLVATTSATTYTQNGAGFFRFQIRARDTAGNVSALTPEVTVVVPACPNDTQPPTTPGSPTVTAATASAISLSWAASTDNFGVLEYDIWRAPGASGGTFGPVGTSTTTSFTDTGLAAGTTYRYQVRARDAAGNASAFSTAVAATTSGSAPGCSAVYRQAGSWSGGFQGEVTVTNTGNTATTGWTVTLAFPNGQTITQLWGGRTSNTASPYTIANESYNAALAPSATTTFGFLGTWNGANNPPSATCTRTP